MVHYHLQLANWLALWYISIFFWPSGPPYDTLPFSTCPLAIPMVLPVYSTGTLAISMVHYHLLLAHWLSLWCTNIFYWPTGCLYASPPSSIGQLALSMIHYHIRPVAPSYVTLHFSTGSLVVSMVHYYLLLTNWLSLWYTTIFFWSTGYLYGTQLASTGPLALTRVLDYLLLAHWLSLWYSAVCYCPTGYLYGTLPSSTSLLA